ncbi:MAG: hypothetical protein JST92_24385 [Deltaproteobacteria bacterium]|nr:hypothetical protein [Deltaproteobacteria bacterium]
MTLRPTLLSALALIAAFGTGCGKQTFIAGLFFQTPAMPNPQAPGSSLGPYNLLTGYVGTIDISDPTKIQDAQIQGVNNAKTTIVYRSCASAGTSTGCISTGNGSVDTVLNVPSKDNGLYELFSNDEPKLTYEVGVHYTLIMEVPSDGSTGPATSSTETDAYGASFTPIPPPTVVEFTNKSDIKHQALNQDMTITRSDPQVDGEYRPAFVVVGQVDPNNPTALPDIKYSSLNYQDPKELLLLALSDQPYRKGSYTIPGSAFAAPGTYIVVLLTIAEGKASANAFVGSTALSGSGDAGLVQVP